MCRCLLVALLVFCLTGASPLAGPPIPASVNGARDTERDESTVATNTDQPPAQLGPEVPDMLSGVSVNKTFLHKVDSDNDEPGGIAASIPELSTHRNEPDQTTNLTDKVNSPRVLDPGTTHQEDSSNNSSMILKAVNITLEDPKNTNETAPKPVVDVSIAVPAAPPTITNDTHRSAQIDDATTLPTLRNTEEKFTEKPELNSTKAKLETVTLPSTPTSRTKEVAAHPPSTQAPGTSVQDETKPQLPPSGQVEVFSPSMGNETQNLVIGFQPQMSEQHADHLQLSGASDPSFLQPSQSAAILAGVFVVVALLGYVGLLVWRRLLEKKYGNREMLVNEDEFYDTSDLRHFEL